VIRQAVGRIKAGGSVMQQRRSGKVDSILALVLFLVVIPAVWCALLWAALNLPVSLFWWLLLVGLSLAAVRGLWVALADIISAWSGD